MASHSVVDYLHNLINLYDQVSDRNLTKQESAPQAPYVGFKLCGLKMLAPMSEVNEVLDVPKLTQIPGVKPWVMGVANSRGKLLPVFDLNLFFAYEAEGKVATQQEKILLVEIGGLYAGLLVSDVYGMQYLPIDSNPTPLADDLQQFLAYSQGMIQQDGLQWLKFSPYALIKNPTFFNAAMD